MCFIQCQVGFEQTGLLSPPADSDGLYHSLSRILADENLRQRLAQSGQAAARKRWSLTTMAKCMTALYTEMQRGKVEA
ncbi:MAG: hypothetical protein K6T63_09005 [Alicyclobacillus herbarius]|uniref:glycosyltransferase n=1 Tax=Alicyclobacillus herbarius TaxID=122960 RepID=UPI0023568267|nr:hypothetical protein [Alicyclobacillus herbarius]MCL6632758.1 hypothetical protein [Alicyclobacillus herbarius]